MRWCRSVRRCRALPRGLLVWVRSFTLLCAFGHPLRGLNPSMCFPCSVPLSWDFASCFSQRWCWERWMRCFLLWCKAQKRWCINKRTRWRSWWKGGINSKRRLIWKIPKRLIWYLMRSLTKRLRKWVSSVLKMRWLLPECMPKGLPIRRSNGLWNSFEISWNCSTMRLVWLLIPSALLSLLCFPSWDQSSLVSRCGMDFRVRSVRGSRATYRSICGCPWVLFFRLCLPKFKSWWCRRTLQRFRVQTMFPTRERGITLSSSSLALWDISVCPLWLAGLSKLVAVLGLMVAMSIAWQRVAHKVPT